MKRMNVGPQMVAATLPVVAAAIALASPGAATSTERIYNSSSSPLNASSSAEGGMQVAQASGVCRQVTARGGLYVREQPNVYSRAIGAVPYGANVTVLAPQLEGWVPVSAPLQGYMFSVYLAPCNPVSTAPVTCRRVTNMDGLVVRAQPSIDSERVAFVPRGSNVTIANRGAGGWVPIQVPIEGYISSNGLAYCP